MDGARRVAREYRDIFEPGSFFLEVQANGMREQLDVNAKLAQLGRDEGIPLVATADAHYVSRQDAKAHDVLMCIASNKTFQDPKRLRHDTDGLFIQSPDDMVAALPDFREAIDNTLRIAEMCNVELSLGKSFLPRFQLPEGVSEDEWIEALEGGLDALPRDRRQVLATPTATGSRWSSASSRRWGSAATSSSSRTSSTGKKHQIPVGPGRGSGLGSIVAWSLRITDLDPLRWNLLFERFLNPERVSMPDFDVDFCQNRRDEVIGYVREKYGKDNVGQIITFGSLKARSVIRDVVRVMGLPFAEGDRIAKLVPDPVQGKTPPLQGARLRQREDPGGAAARALQEAAAVISQWVDEKGVQQTITTKDLLDIAMSLEGLNRQAGSTPPASSSPTSRCGSTCRRTRTTSPRCWCPSSRRTRSRRPAS